MVIATGDFDPASAAPKIRAAFGGAPVGTSFEPGKAPADPGGAKLLLVDKPDATQTYFYIGRPGIDRKNPDRVKVALINLLFGGRFTSMLNQELRVNTGLTYGVMSVVQQPRIPGAIFLTSYTKTDTTAQAIDLALDVLKKLAENGITAEQLASAKAYYKGTFPTQRLETPDQVASAIGDLEEYHLGKDDIDDLFSRVDAVSLEDANAVAKKYFKRDDLTFVLVGNAAKIREAAKKYATKISEVPITKPGFTAD